VTVQRTPFVDIGLKQIGDEERNDGVDNAFIADTKLVEIYRRRDLFALTKLRPPTPGTNNI
jgi:hypothetical protein